MKARINLHGNKPLETHGDWTDLAAAETIYLPKGDYAPISLGVSIEAPEGYYIEVLPRSSTPSKHGIVMANSMGIIDHDYCGDGDVIKFPALAIRNTLVSAGARIAQFRFVKCQEPMQFEYVESLGNADRGGIGSTGV